MRTMQFLLGLCLAAVLFPLSQQQELCQSRNQSEILLSFARSITGSGSWPTSWNIMQINGAIVGLNLSSMNLTGQLSSAWSELPSLEFLDLSSNNFSGPLNLSSTSCSSLKHLNLSNNQLEGPIPPEISKLVNLKVLDLSGNKLAWGVPGSLMQLSALNILNLSNNALNGSIPETVEQLRNLTDLALASNRLTGSIPETVGQLRNLTQLALGSNQLTGSIPASLANCSSLLHLNLTSNNLTGEVHEGFGKLPLRTLRAGMNSLSTLVVAPGAFQQLEVLFLPNNQLKGLVPSGIGGLKMLKVVVLSSNSFSGQIPRELGNCLSLEVLLLDNNDLSGTIPEELFNATKLTDLILAGNQLSDQIPPTISRLTGLTNFYVELNTLSGQLPDLSGLQNLSVISAGENKFSGQMPASYGSLTKLTAINVNNNSLTGALPDFSQLVELEYFSLYSNKFSGRIPDWIGRLPKMKVLDFSSNSFTGPLPSNYRGMSLLRTRQRYNDTAPSPAISTDDGKFYNNGNAFPTTIDFSLNQLSGSIPEEFGLLQNLQSLILSENNLTGTIPGELGQAASITKLVLSHNQLGGSIPTSLSKLSFLAEFDVSNNNLSGPIPSGGQFSTFPNSSFLGNDGLCGRPLGPCSSAASPVSPRGQGQKMIILSVVISICGMGLVAVYLAVVRKRLTRDKATRSLVFGDEKSGIALATILSATDNFHSDYIIGNGGFGTVYRAALPSGLTIAVKKLKQIQEHNLTIDRSSVRELKTAGAIRHRNIVKLRAFFKSEDHEMLVYDFMPNGSVGDLLYKSSAEIPWELRYEIALGTANGLSYLHYDCKPQIIHRDIKPNNILLDSNTVAKIADFGLAKLINNHATADSHGRSLSYVAGSFGYIAPEYASTMRVNEKTDVYSYGVVLLELLARRPPTDLYYSCYGLVSWVRSKVSRKEPLGEAVIDTSLWVTASQQEKREILLMTKIALFCTSDRPADRPTMRQVVEMLRQAREETYEGIRTEMPTAVAEPFSGGL